MKKSLLIIVCFLFCGWAHAQDGIPEDNTKLNEWYNRVYDSYKEASDLAESGKYVDAITKLKDSARVAEGYLANFKDSKDSLNFEQKKVRKAIQNLYRETLLVTAVTYEKIGDKSGKWKDAEKFYQDCIKVDEEYYPPYKCLANMLYQSQQKGSLTVHLKVIDARYFILQDDEIYQLAAWNAYCENREISVRHLQSLFDRGYDITKVEKDVMFQNLSRYFKYEELLAKAKENKDEQEDLRFKLLQKGVTDYQIRAGFTIVDARAQFIDFCLAHKKNKEAEEQLLEMEKDLETLPQVKFYALFQLSSYYCRLGKTDKALEFLKKYKEEKGDVLKLLLDKNLGVLYSIKDFQDLVIENADTGKLDLESYTGRLTLYEFSALHMVRGEKDKVYPILDQLNRIKFNLTISVNDKRFVPLLPEKQFRAIISENVKKLNVPDPFSGKPVVVSTPAPEKEQPAPTPAATPETPAETPDVPKENPDAEPEKPAADEKPADEEKPAPPAEEPEKKEEAPAEPKREAAAEDEAPPAEPEKKEADSPKE